MGIIFVLIAGSLWGAMGIFVRGLAACGLSSLEICFVRMVVSTILMTGYFFVFDRKSLKIKLKDIWCFIGTGVFSLTFFGYCYFTTIQITSMSVAAVLLYTSPVFVLLLSAVFFKEKITKKRVLCVALAILGCAFVSGIIGNAFLNGLVGVSQEVPGGGGEISTFGILLGIGAGLGYGLYSIFGRFAINRGYGPLTITYYSFLFSSIALIFICKPVDIIMRIAGCIGSDMAAGGILAGNKTLVYVIGTAIVVTILPYIFYTIGLTKVENSIAAVVACIEPIMATALGYLVFHEILSPAEIVGIVLVLAAIVMLNF